MAQVSRMVALAPFTIRWSTNVCAGRRTMLQPWSVCVIKKWRRSKLLIYTYISDILLRRNFEIIKQVEVNCTPLWQHCCVETPAQKPKRLLFIPPCVGHFCYTFQQTTPKKSHKTCLCVINSWTVDKSAYIESYKGGHIKNIRTWHRQHWRPLAATPARTSMLHPSVCTIVKQLARSAADVSQYHIRRTHSGVSLSNRTPLTLLEITLTDQRCELKGMLTWAAGKYVTHQATQRNRKTTTTTQNIGIWFVCLLNIDVSGHSERLC